MNRWSYRLAIGLIAAPAILATARAAAVQPYEQAAFQAAQAEGGPVLVFVEAPWCPTCAQERPILQRLYAMPEFARLRVFEVDFDTSKPLLRQMGVQMQSTLVVFRGGKETGRLTGATDPEVIRHLLETAAN